MAAPMAVGSPHTILFADHVEAGKMGEHTRDFRFPEPLALHSVKIVGRSERPQPGLAFEGKTFPDVRMLGLEVFVTDLQSADSTQSKLKSETPGVFLAPGERMITNCITVRGQFMKLSLVFYGQLLSSAEVPSLPVQPSIAQHLRPTSTFQADKLDLANNEDVDGSAGRSIDEELNLDADGDISLPDGLSEEVVPSTFGRALGLGPVQEANARIADHAEWVSLLIQSPEVLEGETVVGRLESLAHDIALLAQRAPDSAAHVSLGPKLACSLLSLASRCAERLEFRPLRATLQALATCLVAAPATAAVLSMKSGLDTLVAILQEKEWCQLSLKLAALQVLLQICSHCAGMESFLGWSEATAKTQPTAHEVVLLLAIEGAPGQPRLEHVALALLRRASLYEALARLDDCCVKLEGTEVSEAKQDRLVRLSAEVLSDVASQLEVLSQPVSSSQDGGGNSHALLGDDVPSTDKIEESASKLPSSIFGGNGTGSPAVDPFVNGQCHLHGFLESFLTGRRLLPNLCILLRRLPRMQLQDRLAIFQPLQRLICALLSCTGGPQLLAADTATYASLQNLLEAGSSTSGIKLPAIPRFPAALVRADLGAPQLAALMSTHVRALRLSLLLIVKTRTKGRGGLLPESDALPLLAALHRLCVRGSSGRGAVVSAFRSMFFTEWLLRQIEGRLEEVAQNGSGPRSSPQMQPSLRHLISILHALVMADPSGAAAERFGGRTLALALRAIQMLLPDDETGEGADGGGSGGHASLEFALDSAGGQGGLGKAVRVGRRSADVECMKNLKELVAQLRPWQQEDADTVTNGASQQHQMLTTAKLLAGILNPKGPRALKRSANEERGSKRLALVLGGHTGAHVSGIEVPEVDFVGGEAAGELGEPDDREKYPGDESAELPLLAMRVLCRRAASGSKEALAIAVHSDLSADSAATGKDGLALLVPWLIRCAGALHLNLEATILREEKKAIANIYATRRAHLQLLEAALQTCAHLLRGLRDAGLVQYRHTELLQTLFLLSQRLTSGIASLAPRGSAGGDPEYRLLWRHSLVWVCRVYRLWVQSFPSVAGGQLLLPLLRHARVLPSHFAGGLLLLATCGNLRFLLPAGSHSFALQASGNSKPGESLQSQMALLPTGTRGGAPNMLVLHSTAGQGDEGRAHTWGQFWGKDFDAQDWEEPEAATAPEACGDPLVRELARDRHTAAAQALSLVEFVNSRKERLSMDEVGELVGLVTQCALTSDALLHLCTARVMEKLNALGIPVLATVKRLAEAALNGVVLGGADEGADADNISGGAARDERDARAVSRLLLLLAHFGTGSTAARNALAENQVETLCLSVLAHNPASSLPPLAISQAIRLLGLMFSAASVSSKASVTALAQSSSAPSASKCRIVSKAVSLLINKPREDATALNASTVGAALELLLGLCSARWLCLNLLFSPMGDLQEGETIEVTLSVAFKLQQCSQRLARELGTAAQEWRATKGTEDESVAQDELAGWLRVAELMVTLCRVVVTNCPTSQIFFDQIMAAGSSPSPGSVLEDVLQVVKSIMGQSQPNGSISPEQSAHIVRAIESLRQELAAKPSEIPPKSMAATDLMSQSQKAKAGNGTAEEDNTKAGTSGEDGESSDLDVKELDDGAGTIDEVVSLLDAAADLEASAEWMGAVAELDSAEPPHEDSKMDWEFDAVVLRKKRQAILEKRESERQAKRLKQQQEKPPVATPAAAPGTSATPAAPATTAASAAPSNAGAQAAAPPAPAATAAAPAPPAQAAPKAPAAPATAVKEEPGQAPAPKKTETKKAEPAKSGGGGPAEALQSFLKDHPEFMRVLQNPKKCLADPRVKTMFMNELNNYPAVKAFLAAKGLQLS
eukprot:TRINITY_DN39323_c0_g1_i1.p1 TRINITY_DN39323_c0_g1~~TRINITY_DN39323_c0_g1_i1.p1  ORF type:complete len:1857 (+),score=399.70 TRINITY_DN39323_c0_g1_i1:64-5634(+)